MEAEQTLTEGEEEGIKTDLAAWWNLSDEPLRHAADGHWRTSHTTDCSQVIITDFRGCDRINPVWEEYSRLTQYFPNVCFSFQLPGVESNQHK